MLVADLALGVDDEGFGRTVNPPVDRHPAVGVEGIGDVGVAQIAQPLAGGGAVVLVVESVDVHLAGLGQFHQNLVLGAAGHAPGGPDVEQRDPARRRRDIGLADGGLGLLQPGQGELRHRLADQRRGHQLGIVAEPEQQKSDQYAEDDQRNEEA